jgi:hypothetical protein
LLATAFPKPAATSIEKNDNPVGPDVRMDRDDFHRLAAELGSKVFRSETSKLKTSFVMNGHGQSAVQTGNVCAREGNVNNKTQATKYRKN